MAVPAWFPWEGETVIYSFELKMSILTLSFLLVGCRGSSGRSLLAGMMYSGGVQSTVSGLEAFLSVQGKERNN